MTPAPSEPGVSGSVNAHKDLPGRGLGCGDFFQFEDFRPAKFTNENRFHSPDLPIAETALLATLEMLVSRDGRRFLLSQTGRAAPGGRLPVVFPLLRRDPRRQRLY